MNDLFNLFLKFFPNPEDQYLQTGPAPSDTKLIGQDRRMRLPILLNKDLDPDTLGMESDKLRAIFLNPNIKSMNDLEQSKVVSHERLHNALDDLQPDWSGLTDWMQKQGFQFGSNELEDQIHEVHEGLASSVADTQDRWMNYTDGRRFVSDVIKGLQAQGKNTKQLTKLTGAP